MHMKSVKSINIFLVLKVFIVVAGLSHYIIPQPKYNMHLTNLTIVSGDIIQFDIFIKSLDDDFYLTSYQCALTINSEIESYDQLSLRYLDNTSQLTNTPSWGIGINMLDGFNELTFASLAGLDTISQNPILVGRFELQNPTGFYSNYPEITWNFEGVARTILTGEYFQDITIPAYHTNNSLLDIKSKKINTPEGFYLFANYPNPFNASTKIMFNVLEESRINISVYNLLGQLVKTLIDEKLFNGTYEVDFDGENLPSGTYFCAMAVNSKPLQIIKMILLR